MTNFDYLLAQEIMRDVYRKADKARVIELYRPSRKIQIRQLFSTLACRVGFFRYSKVDMAKRYINIK